MQSRARSAKILHADPDRCTASYTGVMHSGGTERDVSLLRIAHSMQYTIQNRPDGGFHASFQAISEYLAFSDLAEGPQQTTPEGISFNLGVSLRPCFGLPKTKNARHSWFRANARDSDTTLPDVDDLLGGGAYTTRRLWPSEDRLLGTLDDD